jgi:hypothetical protein
MKNSFVGLLALLFSSLLQAQSCWEKVDNVPFVPILRGKVISADIDDDKDLDVLITGSSASYVGSTILYTNDGDGNFTEMQGTPFAQIDQSSAAFGDIDGDKDQDLIIIGTIGGVTLTTKLYLNDGNGVFTEDQNAPLVQQRLGDVAFADVDGDNDLDVLITGESSKERRVILYRNDGSGGLTIDTTQIFLGVYYAPIAFGDVDGDNDLDVLIVGYGLINDKSTFVSRLYFNDGDGNFTPPEKNDIWHIADGDIKFVDVDKDNDLDLIASGRKYSHTGSSFGSTYLYLNDGTGKFLAVEEQPFPNLGPSSLAIGDIDNDNDPDVMILGSTSTGETPRQQTSLYLNDGHGSFTQDVTVPFDTVRYGSILFFDVENDDDIDILLAGQDLRNDRVANLYLNCGKTVTSLFSTNSAKELTAVPNPFNDQTLISFENRNLETFTLDLVDVRGISVLKINEIQGDELILNRKELLPGMYIVRLFSATGEMYNTTLVLE